VNKHPSVSRRHASILVGTSFIKVADLDSRNGTFIDGRRIDCGELQIGQRLRLGEVEFRLMPAEPSSADGLDSFAATNDANYAVHDKLVDNAPTRLTSCQQSVLQLLLRGLSEKNIAAQLHIERCTVHNHVMNIYRILGVHTRAQLLALLLNGANGHARLTRPGSR
jgi:DNA-binding CsgD family transcriptional regulator